MDVQRGVRIGGADADVAVGLDGEAVDLGRAVPCVGLKQRDVSMPEPARADFQAVRRAAAGADDRAPLVIAPAVHMQQSLRLDGANADLALAVTFDAEPRGARIVLVDAKVAPVPHGRHRPAGRAVLAQPDAGIGGGGIGIDRDAGDGVAAIHDQFLIGAVGADADAAGGPDQELIVRRGWKIRQRP